MRSLLVRCYPAGWRARYGEEFAALLEERPLGPFDVADILLGALDAQLRLRGQRSASHHERGLTMSLRLGGVAAILGGTLIPAGFIITSVDGSDDAYPGVLFMLAGLAALIIALIGLSAFQARRHPRLIWTAFALPAFGSALACVGIVGMGVVGDRPFLAGFNSWEISMLGLFATALGTFLFAVATYRTGTLARPAAGLLAVGSGLLAVVFVVGVTGIGSLAVRNGALLSVLSMAGLLGFAGGWAALGWAAIRTDRPSAAMA